MIFIFIITSKKIGEFTFLPGNKNTILMPVRRVGVFGNMTTFLSESCNTAVFAELLYVYKRYCMLNGVQICTDTE